MVDIAPTLVDLLGLAWPGQGEGLTFRPLLEHRDQPDDRVAYVRASMHWGAPAMYPPGGEHLSYPALTDLVAPDPDWDTRLVLKPELLPAVMCAADRAAVQGHWKVLYRPCREGPCVHMFDLREDPDGQRPLPPDPVLAGRLKHEIERAPESLYLAWPRPVFDAAFAR